MNQVEPLDSNPTYANVRNPSGRESTVSVRELAPCPEVDLTPEIPPPTAEQGRSIPIVRYTGGGHDT